MIVFGLIGLLWATIELQRTQCFARGNQACPSALEYALPGDHGPVKPLEELLQLPLKTPKPRASTKKETSPTAPESPRSTVRNNTKP
jgi:hypothetical protein